MDFKFLPAIVENKELAKYISLHVPQLKKDHALNIQHGIYKGWLGRELSFEEMLTAMLIEKDLEIRFSKGELPKFV